MAVHCSL